MIARLFLISLLLVVAVSVPTNRVPTTTDKEYPTFEEFCTLYNKHYEAHEINFRKALYEQNLAKIVAHNSGVSSHRKGVTKFTDMTEAEFSRMFGYSKSLGAQRKLMSLQAPQEEVRSEYFKSNYAKRLGPNGELPESIDWVALNATTPVKNQGACGSCWAFAGTEALESDVYLETGELMVLAPQAYVDCVQNPNECGGTGGCDGATCDLLFDYAMQSGGCYEPDYPYVAKNGQCHAFVAQVMISNYTKLPSNDADSLKAAVVKQPITISVAASKWAFYMGGVFAFSECDTDINHAVLLVGYGTDPVFGPYWKVQNSWGPEWGEGGFIRLAASTDCATDKTPQHGTACKGGPTEVNVCGTCGMLYDSVYPTGGSVVGFKH